MFTVNNDVINDYLATKQIQTTPGALKIIGVRGCIPLDDSASGHLSLRGDTPNLFSDALGCFGSDFGFWTGTTLPGIAPPPNPLGLAKLCDLSDAAGKPWKFVLGMHHGAYACLIQGEDVSVRRDNNYLDTGRFAIEIHHAGADSPVINDWSEGCQVFQRMADWDVFWAKVVASGANSFEYYLILGSDLVAWMQSQGLA